MQRTGLSINPAHRVPRAPIPEKMYAEGVRLEAKNPQKAISCYEQAGTQAAFFRLGLMYKNGFRIYEAQHDEAYTENTKQRDYSKAIMYFKALEQNPEYSTLAHYHQGDMYLKGDGFFGKVKADSSKAAEHYQKALLDQDLTEELRNEIGNKLTQANTGNESCTIL